MNSDLKLHHIGIVVPKIEESLGEITKFLNFDKINMPTLVDSQKVNVCFLNAGSCYIELIEPTQSNSPISQFAAKGGGIHHLCFEVKDIKTTIDKMVKNGARLLVEPVRGFENRITAFVILNMKNTKCNLIELAEEKIS